MKSSKKKTALKKVRELLTRTDSPDSESDSSTSSQQSEEYSHVPLRTENLTINSLSLENSEMDVETLRNQVATLQQMVEHLQIQQQQGPNQSSGNHYEALCKIPDPIKSIPKFDGNKKQLASWLNTAESTLMIFHGIVSEQQMRIFTTAVFNKIEGKAKDILCLAGNPTTFEEVKLILVNALGDRQELTYYKSQLWQTKMTEGMSIHRYYNKCKEIIQNIKTLAKQKQKYLNNWEAINAFIEEDALAAFLSGLREPYFGYAQAACPEDMEAAYAFVCKFQSREVTASNMEINRKPPDRKFPRKEEYKPYREDHNKFNRDEHKKDGYNKNQNVQTKNTLPQPMEVGSVRSRLTLNKKQINNNEVLEDDTCEDVDLNFSWTLNEDEKT